MKNIPLFVEPLEPRVAPAILVNGGNLLGGNGNPTTGETSSGGNAVTLIKVLSGEALVFFDATNAEITGISVGKHTRLDITGNIYGDIVTNLLPTGRLTDSDNNPANGEDGGILLPYAIKGITTHPLSLQTGDIGRIIAGGGIANVNIAGKLSGIYAGDGIFRDGSLANINLGLVDYNTILPGAQNIYTLTAANAKASAQASVSNVVVFNASQLEIFAGDGLSSTTGVGGIGGSISNVTITHTLAGEGAKPALFLHAGDGGSGTGGGRGGSITNFDDLDSIAYVKIQTGDGGAGSSGTGGAGGSLQNSTITTSSPRYDLLMGAGGSGVMGGKGGGINALNFTNNITGGASLIATGDFNNDGIQDVLLINTVTGEGTLSLGTGSTTNAPYTIALQPATNANGTAGTTPFIAAEGAVPTAVVATDLNGDGLLDFVVSYAGTNNLGVFLNQGGGVFKASSTALPVSPTRIAVGDFSGSTAPDIAVLAGGDAPSVSGGQQSQVFIAQGDGTGALTVLANPATFSGIGTDLVSAQINGVGGTDLFVGLNTGGVDPLFANGSSFTVGTGIIVFNGADVANPPPVDNLDVSTASGGVTLLAFSKNTSVNDTTTTAVTPLVDVISIQADGTANAATNFSPDSGALKARFVANTSIVGVVNPGAVLLYENNAGYGVVATLPSDGVLSDFSAASIGGTLQIVAAGAATNRFFYTSGTLDTAAGLPSFAHFNLPYEERIISFVAGDGGTGTTGRGGGGGSINTLSYTQTLGGGVLEAGGDYNTFVTTGTGGASTGGDGGKGGSMSSIALSLNPGFVNDGQDDTDFASLHAGAGGAGDRGGSGGSISKATSNTVFSDISSGGVRFGAVALELLAGNGGVGTTTTGGTGGSITLAGPTSLSGVTFYDIDSLTPEAAALLVQAGDGGAGVTAGGAGGSLNAVGAQNAITAGTNVARNELGSADIIAGVGGSASQGIGGAGGNITGLDASVQRYYFGTPDSVGVADGWIAVTAGAGGASANGAGGNGGSVLKSTVASAAGDLERGFGVLVEGGAGGDGTSGGGAGGSIKTLTVNTPSESDVFAAVIAAGSGGSATTSGTGGAGGGIKGIAQSKDVNSSITAILGGNGGTGDGGAGGTGGTIKKVDTVGFIGLPANDTTYLGVFDAGIASPEVDALFADGVVTQGIFAGRGGSGATNGSVHTVTARQIAAIGASVDDQGLFGVAAAVTKVNADLIGYDINGGDTFVSSTGANTSPSTAQPIDGFILAASVSGVTTLNSARTSAFTFAG